VTPRAIAGNGARLAGAGAWHYRCATHQRRVPMLMFKRSQLYLALGLAALTEIILIGAMVR
jgi:hypothetical protein